MNDFAQMKIRVRNEEHSKQIQNALFSLGFAWSRNGITSVPELIDKPFLFTMGNGYISWDDDEQYFTNHYYPEYVFENGSLQKKDFGIFLGGTCNNSPWRDELIPLLKRKYFNPVVDTWAEEDYQRELVARSECDILLYVLTPEMTGVYSVAEVVDDSNKRPKKTVLVILNEYNGKCFDAFQKKSMEKVGLMVSNNGAKVFKSLIEFAEWVNQI